MFIHLLEQSRLAYSLEFDGPIELGRQQLGEAPPYARSQIDQGERVIIAPLQDTTVSRRHARITPLTPSRVRIENLSDRSPLLSHGIQSIAPGSQLETDLPLWLKLGDRHVQIEPRDVGPSALASLPQPTIVPRSRGNLAIDPAATLVSPDWRVPDNTLPWLRAVLEVLQNAATSEEFYQLAAKAIVDLAGFDSAVVLQCDGDDWRTIAAASRLDDRPPSSFSRHVVKSVHAQKRTLWQDRPQLKDASRSLANVDAVIATPILDRGGDVVAVVYADRASAGGTRASVPIAPTEAALVELLAGSVANGLARLEQQRQAIAARVQFEQFFTPELARHLEQDPDLLDGREAEISILFADIRRFSTASERLGPARTFAWIRDTMNVLSECVMRHQGVLVDYVGDELIAMWGAPEPQPNHADLACRSALEMLAAQREISQRWQSLTGEPTELGIGICTGPAHVGNIGSERKFKYGPLGNTVNLASRVQGITRPLGVSLLISGSTQASLSQPFRLRRIGAVRVAHIDQPVDLFEVGPTAAFDEAAATNYASALTAFETGDFPGSVAILEQALIASPADGPAQLLLRRARAAIEHPSRDFDAVWEPGSK